MWYTEVLICNYYYRSCKKENNLFASMFPESKIALIVWRRSAFQDKVVKP